MASGPLLVQKSHNGAKSSVQTCQCVPQTDVWPHRGPIIISIDVPDDTIHVGIDRDQSDFSHTCIRDSAYMPLGQHLSNICRFVLSERQHPTKGARATDSGNGGST